MTRVLRCAIYTRKSTEEGLEQDFNSLDAQREACSAFITSQRHEGWAELPALYDDGGFSGGSMERPALARLLADIEAGAVDTVVVYKVDRLTRALADFARIVAIFDAADVSFVSVTQAFNTTTSMGRLTLNVLLSFAQFEREVTAERIRDKIAASKARGIWMGGTPPIGYRPEKRQLVVVPEEADVVRHIFDRYLALRSVRRLQAELVERGYLTPIRISRSDRTSGGCAFSKGKLYSMLSNPVVVGKIRHRDKVYDGQHNAIIADETWERVQAMLADNRRSHQSRSRARNPSPLAGKLFDPNGKRMRPVHTTKKGCRYRYYVSPGLIDSSVEVGARGWRIPAEEIEAALATAILGHLSQPDAISILIDGKVDAEEVAGVMESLNGIRDELCDPRSKSGRQLLRVIVRQVELTEKALCAQIELAPALVDRILSEDADLFTVELSTPIQLKRRGSELKLILQGAGSNRGTPDPTLINTILDARRWFAAYTQQESPMSISEIAIAAGASPGDVSRSIPLAFLSPDLIEAILDGRQSLDLTATSLRRVGQLPFLWDDQHRLLA
ncbi:recombinase family protein [Pseudohalocynthiibacter sp. F2068]|jgi:site-specific DNA recombinase|uniref:recombinase family protein n=1 Tax=Pseudohalocynthiibacter sp. F2068 TaxID=2926418 RepID=UPI001FF4FDB1|nr:recombinase family protein [Pseudohalocynthiibacter sp. F2068]MCK0104323.1 recombinase family protein [Pseudohalocynthiibacter sp. F2068]